MEFDVYILSGIDFGGEGIWSPVDTHQSKDEAERLVSALKEAGNVIIVVPESRSPYSSENRMTEEDLANDLVAS